MRRFFKYILLILLSILSLIIILPLTLYIPFVQDFAINKTVSILKNKTGYDINVGKIRLEYPLGLRLEDINARTEKGDTLLNLDSFKTRVHLGAIFQKRIYVYPLTLSGVKVDMTGIIPSMDLKGNLGTFDINKAWIDLSKNNISINTIALYDTYVDLILKETEPQKDTVPSKPLDWSFSLKELIISQSGFSMKKANDFFSLGCYIPSFIVENSHGELINNRYTVESVDLTNASFNMDLSDLPHVKWFDYNHLDITDINLKIDSVKYFDPLIIQADIKEGTFRDGNKFALKELKGNVFIDSNIYKVEDFTMLTDRSEIFLNADLNADIFDKNKDGKADIDLNATFSNDDILYFTAQYSPVLEEIYPDKFLNININVAGDKKHLEIKNISMDLDKAIDIEIKGEVNRLQDIKNAQGDIVLMGEFRNIDFVKEMIPEKSVRDMISFPKELFLNCDLKGDKGLFFADLTMLDTHEFLKAHAFYSLENENYSLGLKTTDLDMTKFMPKMGIGITDVDVNASGHGFDPFDSFTKADLTLDVNKFSYTEMDFEELSVKLSLDRSDYSIFIDSRDSALLAQFDITGLLKKNYIETKIDSDIKNIELSKFGVNTFINRISTQMNLEAATNLKDMYALKLEIENLEFGDSIKNYYLGDLSVNGKISSDTILLSCSSGDMNMKFFTGVGLEEFMKDINKLTPELNKQISDFTFDINKFHEILPEFDFQLDLGTNNLVNKFLKTMNIGFDKFNLALFNDDGGIKAITDVVNFQKDSLFIKDAGFSAIQRENILDYDARAELINKDPKKAVHAYVAGTIADNNTLLNFRMFNSDNITLFDIGTELYYIKDSLSLSFTNLTPVILNHNWFINDNNYISFVDNHKIYADFNLTGEKGMKLAINSNDIKEENNVNNLTLSLSNIDLANLSEDLPDFPVLAGIINVDMNVDLNPESIIGEGNININELYFDNQRLGTINISANTSIQSKTGIIASAAINLDEKDILNASYFDSKTDKSLNAKVELKEFPLNLADPFIPDQLAKLSGTLSGEVSAGGTIEKPILNGDLRLNDATVNVTYANAVYRFDDSPIIINNNILSFDKYKFYAFNKNPIVIDGDVNFADFSRIMTNLNIKGNDVELLNVKKQRNQMVYGKVFMDINTSISGPVNFLRLRGNVNLKNGTNVTYVLTSTPLSARNRVGSLVTFTNFNDTISTETRKKAQISGMDMLVIIGIDPSVEVGVDLSTNGEDRVELHGGGDLVFKINPIGDMELNGRYTLTGGFVRYNLPVLPVAKTFAIRNGSYVDWTGKLMDPYIDITAAERIRSTVTEDGKGSRVVNFDALIIIKNRLENLSLAFTVEAPEDASIQNQLASMTTEERSKQAMNLIITQTYTGPGTSSKINSNSAINAFIQKEINQFAGNSIKGVDLSFGIDEYDQDAGKRTDYSFKFSKQLFNDRFRIVIGGKVSSGQTDAEQEQSFIDDISLEYTLDRSGSRYIKLFHHSDFESILEGEIIETGLGIVLKRKVSKLKQLFIFNEERRRKAIERQEERIEKREGATLHNEM